MKCKKILTTLLLLCMSFLTLTGCAKIEYIRAIDSTDTIVDKLVVELDESKLNKSGIELSTITDAINNDMISFRIEVEKWKLQFIAYPNIKSMLDEGLKIDIATVKNKVSMSLMFANWQIFGLFYGYTEVEDFDYNKAMEDIGPFVNQILNEESSREDYGLFFIKYSILKNSGILGKLDKFEYKTTNYFEKYQDITNNMFTIEDVDVSQIFAYPDDRIRSNADETMIQGGMTFLQWNLNDKKDGFQMSIYKLGAKTTPWYILALIVSTIVAIVIFVISFKNYKKQNQEKVTRWDVEKDEK